MLGTAVGVDYSASAYTSAGFALAGGGTNFSVTSEAYAIAVIASVSEAIQLFRWIASSLSLLAMTVEPLHADRVRDTEVWHLSSFTKICQMSAGPTELT